MAGIQVTDVSRPKHEELLALSGLEKEITIVIDQATVDAGNPEGTTNLRRGVVLVKNTATGRYTNFDKDGSNGTDDSSTAVVLKYDINGVDTRLHAAAAYITGAFNADKLIVDDPGDFDWSAVQRLIRI
jgi:hypothetical protein